MTRAMAGAFELIVSGDAIINSRISTCDDPGFQALVDLLRRADVVHTQFEQVIHDFSEPDVFPSAEGAWSWFRAPRYVIGELQWLGIDVVSLASNHSLDYSYGGLRETCAALDAAGIPHAGVGENLAAARAPAFLDTPHGRVGLVSACSSFPIFARAGAAREDHTGRPGVNPLRYYHQVDAKTADQIIDLARKLGHWVTVVDDEFAVNPAGLHNTLWRFAIRDAGGVTTVPDEDDLAGNLAAIRHAASQSDFVIAHLHVHEWDTLDGGIATTAAFAETYARAAVDAGAHVVIAQGSHAPMRGIEIYKARPIFYDPGDLFLIGGRFDRQPADFYLRWGHGPEARLPAAGLPEALLARRRVLAWGDDAKDRIPVPRTRYSHEPGFFVPVCSVGSDFRIERVTIHPCVWLRGNRSHTGLPALATGARAEAVLREVDALSRPYGTELRIDNDKARIEIAGASGRERAQLRPV
jgi:poly-gamma-glutamate capsule biosynthesis protein CapA/YwtB (metallophosphatase superfamily)